MVTKRQSWRKVKNGGRGHIPMWRQRGRTAEVSMRCSRNTKVQSLRTSRSVGGQDTDGQEVWEVRILMVKKHGRSGYWWSRRQRATGLQISSLLDWSVWVQLCASMALCPRQVVPMFVPYVTYSRGIASTEGTHAQYRLGPCTSTSSFLSIFTST